MKLLVVCQYYHPEPFRIADLCEGLVKEGHEVTVITGLPNYPMGEIYSGYENGARREEIINGVKVHRCFEIPRKKGALYRFLNYYSFSFSSTAYVKKLKEEFDAVLVYQLSPVMMANAGIAYKKKHHKRLALYCLDLWPESLKAGGINEKSVVFSLFHKISAKIYKQVDKLMISSKSFAKYFKDEFGINNTIYLPQYAEELFAPDKCVKKTDETIDLMFAGNIGTVQGVDIMIRTAEKMKDVKNLYWHIVGDGIELENLKDLAESLKLSNVIFHGRKPIEEMPAMYAMADAMVVTMKEEKLASMTLPAKVQSYMAAGKPVLGSVSGETKQIITEAECGFCASAEDIDEFEKCVREFLKSNIKKLGTSARSFYEDNFTKEIYLKKLLENLE